MKATTTPPPKEELPDTLVAAAARLARRVDRLKFRLPVFHVYNPLKYAWPAHELYLRKFAATPKKILFLGMNPGPFGMVQTGVPFGEIAAVKDWLGIVCQIAPPRRQHARRPIQGFDCARSEVSGQRVWNLFASRFGSATSFFAEHFVVNYCPLAFLEKSGRNLTPDKLPAAERMRLFAACDEHLRENIRLLKPRWVVGIGDFAARRAEVAAEGSTVDVCQILHPSPANPLANRGWAQVVEKQLRERGIWTRPT